MTSGELNFSKQELLELSEGIITISAQAIDPESETPQGQARAYSASIVEDAFAHGKRAEVVLPVWPRPELEANGVPSPRTKKNTARPAATEKTESLPPFSAQAKAAREREPAREVEHELFDGSDLVAEETLPPPLPPLSAELPPAVAALESEAPKETARAWWDEVFDEEFLRFVPLPAPAEVERTADFLVAALALKTDAAVLQVGCGAGDHSLALSRRQLNVTGVDFSLPLTLVAGERAQKVAAPMRLYRLDPRELPFVDEFEAAFCIGSSWGYFSDEDNRRMLKQIARGLRPGGRFCLEIIHRDYAVTALPSRSWREGEGCLVFEESEFNYPRSRVEVRRNVIFPDGRQREHLSSVRLYALHEVVELLRAVDLRVTGVTGGFHHVDRFYGHESPQLIVVAQKGS